MDPKDLENLQDILNKAVKGAATPNELASLQAAGITNYSEALQKLKKGGEEANKTLSSYKEGVEKASIAGKFFNNSINIASSSLSALTGPLTGSTNSLKTFGTAMQQIGTTVFGQKVGAILGSLGGLASQTLEVSDSIGEMYKAFTQTSLASDAIQNVLGEGAETTFAAYREGFASVAEATGQSVDVIKRQYGELYKASQFIADGFDTTASAAEKAQKGFEAYEKTVRLARATGIDFNDMSSLMSDLFKNQGIRSTEAHESIAILKKGIEGSTMAMPSAVSILKNMAATFKDVASSSRDMAAAIGFAAQQQKNLAESGKYTYKSAEQAAEGVAKALGGVVSAQKDWGQALFYTGLAGGGMEEAFDFMFAQPGEAGYKSPMEQAKMMMQGIGGMFGGDVLTREEAKQQGRMGEFMAQTTMIQQAYGLQSPQEAARFAGLMEKAAEGDSAAFEQMQKLQEKGSTALDDILDADEKHFTKLYSSSEVGNVLLSRISANIGGIVRTGVSPVQQKAIEGAKATGLIGTPSSKMEIPLEGDLKQELGLIEQIKKQMPSSAEGVKTPSSPAIEFTPPPSSPVIEFTPPPSSPVIEFTPPPSSPVIEPSTPPPSLTPLEAPITTKIQQTTTTLPSPLMSTDAKASTMTLPSTPPPPPTAATKIQQATTPSTTEAKPKTQIISMDGMSMEWTSTGAKQSDNLGTGLMWKTIPGADLASTLAETSASKTEQLNKMAVQGYLTPPPTTPIIQAQKTQAKALEQTSTSTPTAYSAGEIEKMLEPAPAVTTEATQQPITIPINLTMDGKVVAQTTVQYIINTNALGSKYQQVSAAKAQTAT